MPAMEAGESGMFAEVVRCRVHKCILNCRYSRRSELADDDDDDDDD